MAKPPPLDAALRAKFAAAREADAAAELNEPRARHAYFDDRHGRVVVELKSGDAFAFQPELVPELAGLAPDELAAVQPSPDGEGLYWHGHDVHLETAGVLAAMLGPAMFRAFAAAGGRATSERKAAAARANGAKGGRPRKDAVHRYRPDPGFGILKVAEVRQPRPDGDPGGPPSRPADGTGAE